MYIFWALKVACRSKEAIEKVLIMHVSRISKDEKDKLEAAIILEELHVALSMSRNKVLDKYGIPIEFYIAL